MKTTGESAPAPGGPGADVTAASAVELRALYAAGVVSPVEVVEVILARAGRVEPAINAFITLAGEQALAQAEVAEQALREKAAAELPLLGIPVSIKDLTPTLGIRTTRGSLLHRDWIPSFDAVAVERIKAAGGVILGKTNTCEAGWKGDSGNRLIGPTHNPWRRGLTAGGSSGGSAAAVAAGLGPLATGTDGAGSVRIPAAFCGVVGFKPSFGRIPYHPPSPENLSHLGPLSRTVSDAALLLDVLAGADARDPTSLPSSGDRYLDARITAGEVLDIAWSPTLGFATPSSHVLAVAERAVTTFEEMGHRVELVEPRLADPHWILERLISAAEAAEYGPVLDDVRGELDPGHVSWIECGLRMSAAEVASAAAARTEFCESMRLVLEPYDLLLTPTVPVEPFPAGWDTPTEADSRSPDTLSWTPYTYPFNLTGQPAVSVPAGFTEAGLPVGLQMVGRWRDDASPLRAAFELEHAAPWADAYRTLTRRLAEGDGSSDEHAPGALRSPASDGITEPEEERWRIRTL